jgi:hypothetical protein
MWKAPTQDIPLFEPGLPALRIQENVVRVAIGLALAVIGAGPFEIANNHFSTGGGITLREDPAAAEAGALSARAFSDPGVLPSTPALTVAIVNLGEALELTSLAAGFSGLLQGGDVKGAALSSAPSGAVQFSSNVCQFEGRASRARGLCSVGILSLDHIHFGGNHLWFDAAPLSALADGLLIGGSIQAVNNRWQEAAEYPVILSGVTAANMNITTNNISTYCLYATAPKVGGKQFLVEKPNLELLCEGDIVKRLSLTGAMSAAERAK